ncbi:MAG: hypothetical protein Q8M56_06695, partial [Desulfobacterales bacterium]|nr:hypothetical protein [Desulfobacterales bacterium]
MLGVKYRLYPVHQIPFRPRQPEHIVALLEFIRGYFHNDLAFQLNHLQSQHYPRTFCHSIESCQYQPAPENEQNR